MLLVALGAITPHAYADIERVSIHGPPISAGQQRRIAGYWSASRMRSAHPLEQLSRSHTARASTAETSRPRLVRDAAAPPYNMVGRIFARQGNVNYWCSGVALNSPDRRLVLTAGHCLWLLGRHGEPSGPRDLVFVPAYENGYAPYGVFVMEKEFILRPWRQNFNPNYDMGAISVFPNDQDQNVADAVGGGANLAVDQPRNQSFKILGYPGTNPQRMWECNGTFAGASPMSRYWSGPSQTKATCFLARGASGGPWFIGEPAVVNGLTSEALTLRRHTRYLTSPYFSSESISALTEGL